jgi:hypothetical protein
MVDTGCQLALGRRRAQTARLSSKVMKALSLPSRALIRDSALRHLDGRGAFRR